MPEIGFSPRQRAANRQADNVPTLLVATADVTTEWPVVRAPRDGEVMAWWTPTAAVTGANTNSRTIHIFNRGAAGAGTTDLSGTGVAFVSGTNGVANVPIALVASNTRVRAGDVLTFQSEKVGTGLALPAGLVTIEYSSVDARN